MLMCEQLHSDTPVFGCSFSPFLSTSYIFFKFSSHEIFIESGQLPSKSEMVWVYAEEG